MILCFDIGGTAIKLAEAYAVDDIRPGARLPTPAQDYPAFIAALRAAIAEAREIPKGLAFSIAGVIDAETGRATVANIPCLNGRKIIEDFEAELGLPVVLANDADCFALAEAGLGAGRGYDVVLGIIIGTGIGGGVVVRGNLINARGGLAGEWGHGPIAQRQIGEISLPAFPCGCGQTGCLDAICSARGMEKLHAHLHGASLDAETIIKAWQKHEPAACQTISVWLELLSGPLAMIVNLLGADLIAAGGGLAKAKALIAAVDVALRQKTLRKFDRRLLVSAECPIEPGLVGAALLGFAKIEGERPLGQ